MSRKMWYSGRICFNVKLFALLSWLRIFSILSRFRFWRIVVKKAMRIRKHLKMHYLDTKCISFRAFPLFLLLQIWEAMNLLFCISPLLVWMLYCWSSSRWAEKYDVLDLHVLTWSSLHFFHHWGWRLEFLGISGFAVLLLRKQWGFDRTRKCIIWIPNENIVKAKLMPSMWSECRCWGVVRSQNQFVVTVQRVWDACKFRYLVRATGPGNVRLNCMLQFYVILFWESRKL